MYVNSCNWPLPSQVARHQDFKRGFDCSIFLEAFTSYVDSRLSVRGQLHPPMYVFLGSNLHICKRRQNSDILAISLKYLIKKDFFPGIETGGNDFIVLAILSLLPQMS